MERLIKLLRAACVGVVTNKRPEAEIHIRMALKFIDEAAPDSPVRAVRGHVEAASCAVSHPEAGLGPATEALDQAMLVVASLDGQADGKMR